MMERPNATVLVSGASFAGLATAWWMNRLGYRVTVVEVTDGLKKGGTPVDIRDGVIDVVRRMGLLERIAAAALPPRAYAFVDIEEAPAASVPATSDGAEDASKAGWEIERDVLLDMLFERVAGDVEIRFGASIAAVVESADEVRVRFADGSSQAFSLVIGCDGTHSAVRRMCFGEESSYVRFLGIYFALAIVGELLIPENTGMMVTGPGRTIMLSAYNGKSDVAFAFRTADEIEFDRRDREQQQRMIVARFIGDGWRTCELLEKLARCDNFYFDKLCQVRMPAWTKGRIALVGDAGYCPSPAAGLGGSMALLGAAALADAFERHPDDLEQAFRAYDAGLRPTVERIQRDAVDTSRKLCSPLPAGADAATDAR